MVSHREKHCKYNSMKPENLRSTPSTLELRRLTPDAWISRWGNLEMPVAAGGIIVAPQIVVREDIVEGACAMQRKFSLAGPGDPTTGLPINGARIGIESKPEDLSIDHLKSILSMLHDELQSNLGTAASVGISAEQVNQAIEGIVPNPQFGIIQGLNLDADTANMNLHRIFHEFLPEPISGRHRHLTDVLTGTAAARAIPPLLNKDSINLADKRIALQGFGAVGGSFAHTADMLGAHITMIGNTSGCFDTKETPVSDILSSLSSENNFKLRPDMNIVPLVSAIPHDIISKPCDILVLAGPSRTITTDDVSTVQAEVIVELANMAVAPDAKVFLKQKGITVIPFEPINIGNAAAFAIAQMNGKELTADEILIKTINHVIWINEQIRTISFQQDCSLTEAVNIAVQKGSLWKHILNV